MATSRAGKDACDLLDADHRLVRRMFKDYEALTGSRARGTAQKKLDLAQEICQLLTVHAQIEEEIFYPAVRAVIKDSDLLDEATVEHQTQRDLISQLQGAGEADPMFDARVRVLGEYVDHHVKEEKTEIFAKARAARKLDLMALREKLEQRREALMGSEAESAESQESLAGMST